MTQHELDTPDPIDLHVELGRGDLRIRAAESTQTTIELHGDQADEVVVKRDGDRVAVMAPRNRTGFFGAGSTYLRITISVPLDSEISAKTGSADIGVTGPIGSTHLRSGSGAIVLEATGGPAVLESGSGDIRVDQATHEMRLKSGSGEVRIIESSAAVAVSTGSGDIEVGHSTAPVAAKSGSGRFRVAEAHTDVSFATGSGDVLIGRAHAGRITIKGASCDARVAVAAGVPVWTDVSTLSGEIDSRLSGGGEPEPGAPYVELRVNTVSGDITLTDA